MCAVLLGTMYPLFIDALGLGKSVGQIAPGYSADIIAVPADPLADIRVLEHVAFVMKQGVVYKQ